MENNYEDTARIAEAVAGGGHRQIVGDMWQEIGRLQFEFMIQQGLKSHHRLVDVGCGSLRGGVHFIEYLEPGSYHGLDINRTLIDAGLQQELTADQRAKLSPKSFSVSDVFQFDCPDATFDFGIALSLFTHLSFNKIRLCLEQLHGKMKAGGVFFATVFETEGMPISDPRRQRGGKMTFGYKDPFHYSREDLLYMGRTTGWNVQWYGDFSHPRGQQMVRLTPA